MKLIDILVEELPKRGGWMEGVEHAWCDPDGEIRFRNGGCKPDFYPETDVDIEFRVPDPSYEDDSRYIITRKQYEAALAAKNDGWIEWGGGECPVPVGTLVDVKYRSGEINQHVKAAVLDNGGSIDTACAVRWSRMDAEYDIIAYRLHKPQELEQAEADDESDLNECIGQDAAPVWNGEGLPPAGCECEYLDSNNEWHPVTIKYASNQIVVICGMTNIFGEKQETEIAKDVQLDKPQFRPIRSEADRKRDAAVEAIDRYMPEFIPDTPNDYYNSKKIYDAIAAGKIPGVKLED